jgi:uncharacterized protein YndB with AHSA1/START domain
LHIQIHQLLKKGMISMESQPHVNARVTRRFNASPERVFDAWLDVEKVRKWFAPGMGEMVRVETDPRIGGSFFFVQRRNGQDVEHTGEYVEIDRPRRLVFTWRVPPSTDSSRVSIDIVPLEAGSEVTLTHELHPDWAEYASRAEGAWANMLDAIAQTLS